MLVEVTLSDTIKTASQELADILQCLPHELLQPFLMANIQGKSFHEIALQLNLTESQVKNRLKHALTFCRRGVQYQPAFRELARSIVE